MTSRGLALLGATVALWIVARTYAITELQMAAVGCLVLLVVAVVWALLLPADLRARRMVHPSSLWAGQTAQVHLTVANHGRLPTPSFVLAESTPTGLVAPQGTTLPRLRPGEETVLVYPLRGVARGRWRLGPVRLHWQDPFGLVRRTRTLAVVQEVTVHPPVWRLPPGLPMGAAAGSGSLRGGRVPASSGELADLREHVPGDDLRSVHWPSTARRGRLMVRRSESGLTSAAVLVLDRRADRHRGRGATDSFETAVAAAASVSFHLAAQGRPLLLVDGPPPAPPRPRPFAAWLDHLAATSTTEIDIVALLRQVGEGMAGDGTLVAIVTTPTPDELHALVRAGRRFSTRVALILDTDGTASRTATVVSSLRTAGWRAAGLAGGGAIDTAWLELLRTGRRPGRSPVPPPHAMADG